MYFSKNISVFTQFSFFKNHFVLAYLKTFCLKEVQSGDYITKI